MIAALPPPSDNNRPRAGDTPYMWNFDVPMWDARPSAAYRARIRLAEARRAAAMQRYRMAVRVVDFLTPVLIVLTAPVWLPLWLVHEHGDLLCDLSMGMMAWMAGAIVIALPVGLIWWIVHLVLS